MIHGLHKNLTLNSLSDPSSFPSEVLHSVRVWGSSSTSGSSWNQCMVLPHSQSDQNRYWILCKFSHTWSQKSITLVDFLPIQSKPFRVNVFVNHSFRKFTLARRKSAFTSLRGEFTLAENSLFPTSLYPAATIPLRIRNGELFQRSTRPWTRLPNRPFAKFRWFPRFLSRITRT